MPSILASRYRTWQNDFYTRIIIELNWSLEADTLPQWSRCADPVLDRSKKLRDESRMPEKLHESSEDEPITYLGSDILC
jgi:hypothetical protein